MYLGFKIQEVFDCHFLRPNNLQGIYKTRTKVVLKNVSKGFIMLSFLDSFSKIRF